MKDREQSRTVDREIENLKKYLQRFSQGVLAVIVAGGLLYFVDKGYQADQADNTPTPVIPPSPTLRPTDIPFYNLTEVPGKKPATPVFPSLPRHR